MTPNDQTAVIEDQPGPTPGRLALALLGATLVLMSLGGIVGFTAAVIDGGLRNPGKSAIVIGIMAVLLAAGALILKRMAPYFTAGPLAPRAKRSRRMLIASMFVGAIVGVALTLGTGIGEDPLDVLAGPIPPAIAAAVIAIWLIVVPVLSWNWWKNVDEVEAGAYKTGALYGVYAYAFIAPTWWVGWRGGFLPEPQEMVTFLIVMTVWGLGWMRGRF